MTHTPKNPAPIQTHIATSQNEYGARLLTNGHAASKVTPTNGTATNPNGTWKFDKAGKATEGNSARGTK